ncbi:MAG: hypothetical protein ABI867_05765 [Kofleriaceae bacterium]
MDSGAFEIFTRTPRVAPLPPAIDDAIARFLLDHEYGPLEVELADRMQLVQVLIVQMDWVHRRAWSPAGRISPRLESLVPEVAGARRRGVLDNAILEPIGAAPAPAVLVFKGLADRLFQQHTLRAITRIGVRLAPAFAARRSR